MIAIAEHQHCYGVELTEQEWSSPVSVICIWTDEQQEHYLDCEQDTVEVEDHGRHWLLAKYHSDPIERTGHITSSPLDPPTWELLIQQSLLDDTSISPDPNPMRANSCSSTQLSLYRREVLTKRNITPILLLGSYDPITRTGNSIDLIN